MKKAKKAQEIRRFSLVMPEDALIRLKKEAAENGYTIAALSRRIILDYLSNPKRK